MRKISSQYIVQWLKMATKNPLDSANITREKLKSKNIGTVEHQFLRLADDFEVEDKLILQDLDFRNIHLILESDFSAGVEVQNCRFKALEFRGKSVHILCSRLECKELSFQTFEVTDISIYTCKNIDKLLINYTYLHRYLDVVNSRFNECIFEFSTFHSTSRIDMTTTEIDNLQFRDIINNGNILFTECGPSEEKENLEGKLKVSGSILGRVVFHDFKFDNYNEIIIASSNLDDIEIYISFIPENKLWTISEPGQLTEPIQLFSSLSKIMGNSGNKELQFKYHRNYLENLRLSYKKQRINWGTRIALFFDRYSSKYGSSWLQPLTIILLWGMPIFYIYFVTIDPTIQFGWPSGKDWNLLWSFIGKYCQFLWPTHKVDFIGDPSLWAAFDIFHRIVNGYLIYQVITAFRRISKI